ncbi:MAG: 2-oxoacid:acceptor oxidoreductase family protein [Fimbriimonadales bacterium]
MIGDPYKSYLRETRLPSIWCPGCGNGIIVKALLQAIATLGFKNDEVVVVGGIGCSGRTPFLLDFDTMHTTHRRALAFATGVKLMHPEWHVITIMGDGDAAAIGGNHFIHACRRNIDITAIIFNNDLREPYESLHYLREITMPLDELEQDKTEADLLTQLPMGVFHEELHSEYTALYRQLCERLQEKASEPKRASEAPSERQQAGKAYAESEGTPLLPSRNPLQIRLSGAGGQGLSTAGVVLAEAAMFSGKQVVQTQSYGPEARLGASKAELIISDRKIACPEVTTPDILLCLSQDAYDRYFPQARPDTIVILDVTNIQFEATVGRSEVYALPITETAAQLGGKQVANVVALGVLSALTNLVPWQCLQEAVLKRVPARFRELNARALEAGRGLIEATHLLQNRN